MTTAGAPPRPGEVVAHWVLVAAPVLGFQALRLPGIVTLGMSLPLGLLLAAFCRRQDVRLPTWPLLLVAALSLSVLWGDDPLYSVQQLRTYVPLALAVIFAGCLADADSIMLALHRGFAIIVATSCIVLLISPGSRYYDTIFALHGQFEKNTYGGILVFALILASCRPSRWNVAFVPGLIALIALNHSVTAWATGTAAVLFIVTSRFVFRRVPARTGLPVFFSLVFSAAMALFLVLSQVGDRVFALVGKDPTLTERTVIWAACWREIKRAPVLGHGAFTFLNAASNSPVTQEIWLQFSKYLPPHPHNGFLDLAGQLGLVGVVLFIGLVVHSLRAAIRSAFHRSAAGGLAIVGIGFILFFGSTEPTYLGQWAIVTFTLGAMAQRADEETAAQRRPALLAPPQQLVASGSAAPRLLSREHSAGAPTG